MEGWETILLNEVIREDSILLGRGNIISSKDIAEIPGSYPIYSSSAKSNGEFGRYGNFMFNEELITWSIDGGGRFFYRLKHKFSVTNVCGYMRVSPSRWNTRFVYYLLDLQHKNIAFDYQTKAHPSVIKNLYFLVRLPIEEQTQIAAILSTIDRAIKQTEAIIAKQQRIKTGLMQDFLTKGIDEDGNVRSEATHEFKDSPLGRIPAEWKISSIEEEFIIQTGFTLGEHRRPRKNTHPYLRVANVQREEIFLNDLAEIEVERKELEKRLLERNDLLIVEGHANPEEIGRCSIVQNEAVGLTFQNHLFRLRSKNLKPHFCLAWLNSSFVRSYWRNTCGTSSGLNTINQKMLNEILIPVPKSDEQNRICTLISAKKQLIKETTAHLVILRLTKTGLMQDLLTGNVRVTALLANQNKTPIHETVNLK